MEKQYTEDRAIPPALEAVLVRSLEEPKGLVVGDGGGLALVRPLVGPGGTVDRIGLDAVPLTEEIEQAGDRFSYVMRRPGRHFQVDFDLKTAVDPPPAPWGHE